MSVSDLADYIRDSAWTFKLRDQLAGVPAGSISVDPEDGSVSLSDEVDESEDAAEAVFDLLSQRQEILQDAYPYQREGERLVYRGPADFNEPYLALLAITLLHAYRVSSALDPRAFFEEIVGLALSKQGLLVGNFARERRSGLTFDDALERIGQLCKLRPSLGVPAHRRHAHDEGVDVIAHLKWIDTRPFHWVFLIQATCGISETWQDKMFQPSISMWKQWLGLSVLPKAILAVPHHIPSREALYLADRGDGERLILDRLRLCEFEQIGAGEAPEVAAFLRAVKVEFG